MTMKNRDVVVLGLGLTGLSGARWAARHGARVRVADTRPDPPLAAKLAAELPQVPLSRGPSTALTRADAATIVISPGLAKDQPVIAAAVARGAELVGDIELFARALRPAQRVLAITGSNGKSTVTSLAGELARAAGLSASVVGNIGEPVLDVLAAHEHGAPWRTAQRAAESPVRPRPSTTTSRFFVVIASAASRSKVRTAPAAS